MEDMMRSVVILHGSFGSPYENWFGSVARELSAAGVACFVPHLPTPDGQDFVNWARILDAYFAAGVVDDTSAIIAHSSGAMFAVRYIATRTEPLSLLVTVSGFNGFRSGDANFDDINERLFVERPSQFSEAASLITRRVAYYSPSDPYLPYDELSKFADALDAESREIADAGHFNEASGYTAFEELTQLLLGK